MPLIETKDLCKEYPQPGGCVTALRDANLAVERGEFVVVFGESGSGKTTLLSLLGALGTPTRGSVRFEGEALESASSSRLAALRCAHFGFVFQDFLLVRHLTALDNVLLPLSFSGRQDLAKDAGPLLEHLNLGARLGHRPDALSRGEMQRVALARALITQPKVIFADEPSANLDQANSAVVWDLLQRFHREKGLTVIVATHNQDMARRATRGVRLAFGEVVSDGSR